MSVLTAVHHVESLAPGETWRHFFDDLLEARRMEWHLRKCFAAGGYSISQYRGCVIVTKGTK